MKILHLISSPRGEASVSIKLGNAIVEKLLQAHPGSTVKTHDLTKNWYPHLDDVHLASFYTPADSRTPQLQEAVKHSDGGIAELKEADIIVIGAPMYSFTIHSSLKAWIDHIARSNETFSYSEEKGVEGLVKNKKVYVAVSSGFIYSEGPMQAHDFVAPYLKFILGFLGMTDVTIVRAEGVNIPATKDTALNKAINSIEV